MAEKEWFSASELAGLPGLPRDKSNINRRANKEGWKRRQKSGVKGVAYEFHISSLPLDIQEKLGSKIKQPEEHELDTEVLAKIIEAVEVFIASRNKKISNATKAKVVALLYRAAISSKIIDLKLVKETLELVA